MQTMSPGQRQRRAGQIIQLIRKMREHLETIEERCEQFQFDSEVIPAVNVEYLGRDMASLTYLIGQVNGALVLPDMFEEQ